MSIETQLSTFMAFFVLGFTLYLIYTIIIKLNINRLWIYLIFLTISILFMKVIYNLNGGNIHVYFILMMFLGTIFSKYSVNYIINLLKKLINFFKR